MRDFSNHLTKIKSSESTLDNLKHPEWIVSIGVKWEENNFYVFTTCSVWLSIWNNKKFCKAKLFGDSISQWLLLSGLSGFLVLQEFPSKPGAENGALLTVIARFLLHGCDGAVFMSQEELLQLSHFVSQQGDFTLLEGRHKTAINSTVAHIAWSQTCYSCKVFFSQKQKRLIWRGSLLGCSIHLYPKTKSEELKLIRNLNQVKKTSLNNSLLYIHQSVAQMVYFAN